MKKSLAKKNQENAILKQNFSIANSQIELLERKFSKVSNENSSLKDENNLLKQSIKTKDFENSRLKTEIDKVLLKLQETRSQQIVSESSKRQAVNTFATKDRISKLLQAIPYLKEIGIALGLILVMAVLVFLTAKVEDPKQMAERTFEEVSQQAQQATELKPEPPTAPSTNLTLQVQFENQTRMRVVTDGRDTTDTIYKAGDTKIFQAQEKFNLRIRTGGSVTLVLAGKNLGTFGQLRKVLLLNITSAGVTEQRAFTPQVPKPPSALPLDTLSIRRPRRLN